MGPNYQINTIKKCTLPFMLRLKATVVEFSYLKEFANTLLRRECVVLIYVYFYNFVFIKVSTRRFSMKALNSDINITIFQ